MNENYKEKIKKLSNLTREEIGKSEEDVKINFIVPLFEAFGHERLKFEHQWKDALVEKLNPSCKLVIETKNYDKVLNRELKQLERYCNEERPLLGIIANGIEMRIFSYFWRYRVSFNDSLIYCFKRKDLQDEIVFQTLDNIISRDNLLIGKAKEFIEEREKEIESAENSIREIEEESKVEERSLNVKIEELIRKEDEIKTQINHLKGELDNMKNDKKARISRIWSDLGIEPPSIPIPPTGLQEVSERDEANYRKNYRKQLENPDSLGSKMAKHIRDNKEVTWAELKKVCVSQFGCKSESSGSIGAYVTVLEEIGHVVIEGRGDNKRIRWIST